MAPVIADTSIMAEGRLEPVQFAEIAFTASGVISEVLVQEGEAVKKGQPLIQLGDASDTNYASAQLELVSAQQAYAVGLVQLRYASGTLIDVAETRAPARDTFFRPLVPSVGRP